MPHPFLRIAGFYVLGMLARDAIVRNELVYRGVSEVTGAIQIFYSNATWTEKEAALSQQERCNHDADSQYYLGLLNFQIRDYNTALFWFKKASEQGDRHAYYYVARCCEQLLKAERKSYGSEMMIDFRIFSYLQRSKTSRAYSLLSKYWSRSEDKIRCLSHAASTANINALSCLRQDPKNPVQHPNPPAHFMLGFHFLLGMYMDRQIGQAVHHFIVGCFQTLHLIRMKWTCLYEVYRFQPMA